VVIVISFCIIEIVDFLKYITGGRQIVRKRIQVEFNSSPDIATSTCFMKLTIPSAVCDYQTFSSAMKAVIPNARRSYTMV